MKSNRNLHTITTSEEKHRLLAKGRRDVIDAICKLPVMSHDPNSFIIDIPLANVSLIAIFNLIRY